MKINHPAHIELGKKMSSIFASEGRVDFTHPSGFVHQIIFPTPSR
jgi:hypothetical protein